MISTVRSIEEELIHVERELLPRSFREYIPEAWRYIEPAAAFVSNWHIDAIAEHLQAVADGHIMRLIVNVPPGSTKSITTCVMFPTWCWTRPVNTPGLLHVGSSFIFGSYSATLVKRDSNKCLSLFGTSWFQERWGHLWKPGKEWGAFQFRNTMGGFRLSTTIAGVGVGEHADCQVVDDPIKPLDASNQLVDTAALERCREWWDGTMSTRKRSIRTTARIIIMQRIHQKDLAGHVLEKDGGYVHLRLPMRYEVDNKCRVFICKLDHVTGERGPRELFFEDPRTEEGQLLDPRRFPAEEVDRLEIELGSARVVAAQLQQRPSPASGELFKMEYVRHWTALPRRNATWIQSWDCAFKDLKDSSWVVGQVWAACGADYYLVDQIRAKLSFSGTCKAIAILSARWPRAYLKLIEDKANGPAVVSMMRRRLSGLRLVNPQGGKEARANAIEPLWASGNVYLPSLKLAPWVVGFISEHVGFPAVTHNDQVDAASQALLFLHGKTIQRYREAMEKYRDGVQPIPVIGARHA